jgi:carbonic anhydrase/acetyltransferase-like protein (isoleucine patch superfamily)
VSIESFNGVKPQLGNGVYIHPMATVVGNVCIGNDSSVWPNCAIRGDVNSISIGQNTNVQDNSVLHCTHDGPYTPGGIPLVIGDNVTIGHKACLHACTIGDHCLIGISAIILDGARIEPYTLIGAGSLVPPGKELDGGYLWLGNPIKKIRPLTKKERAHIDYSAKHYVRLKNQY